MNSVLTDLGVYSSRCNIADLKILYFYYKLLEKENEKIQKLFQHALQKTLEEFTFYASKGTENCRVKEKIKAGDRIVKPYFTCLLSEEDLNRYLKINASFTYAAGLTDKEGYYVKGYSDTENRLFDAKSKFDSYLIDILPDDSPFKKRLLRDFRSNFRVRERLHEMALNLITMKGD